MQRGCSSRNWFHSKTILATACIWLAIAGYTSADIFEWEWIDPNNQTLGVQQSTTITPDGSGADATLDAELSGLNLTKAYLIGADLRYANLMNAKLTKADLTDAEVGGAGGRGAAAGGGT